MTEIVAAVRAFLAARPDLRLDAFAGAHPLAGHCYVAAEAVYHATGGRATWVVCRMRVGTVTHWFLRSRATGEVCDPTADQFDMRLDYSRARATGFLTREPSMRCAVVLQNILKSGCSKPVASVR